MVGVFQKGVYVLMSRPREKGYRSVSVFKANVVELKIRPF